MKSSIAWTGQAHLGLIGFHVVDQACWPIGDLCALWFWQEMEKAQFLGIRTPWTTAQELLVPVEGVTVHRRQYIIRVPYSRDMLYKAPVHPSVAVLTLEHERNVYLYYDVRVTALSITAPKRLTHCPVNSGINKEV